MTSKKKSSEKELSFEQELEKLEALVANLESGDIPLEESLNLFEEGVLLYKSCKKRMGSIEIKINKLTELMKEESLEE